MARKKPVGVLVVGIIVWIWWRVSAKKRMARYLNQTLADAAAKSHASEITILTFGFRHVVMPLVANLPFKTHVIASAA